MRKQDTINQYLYWLSSLVCDEYHQRYYQNLLESLHSVAFTWSITNDENRAIDGENLREQFADEHNYDVRVYKRQLEGSCSILEMLVALSCRCENNIMDDRDYGDRTNKWFWTMIHSLKLDLMDDGNYDEDYVQFVIDRLLTRTYKRDGEGGLFHIPGIKKDLRKAEIWYQMCWYLDTIIDY